jgi:hypothetical protein
VSNPQFILTHGSLTLEISKISSPQFPRARIEPLPKIEYSNNGSTVGDGPVFAPKHLWTFSSIQLTKQETIILQRMYAKFAYKAPTAQDATILLSDHALIYCEPTPRTKQLAASSTEEIVDGQVAYFGKFKTWFIEPPKYEAGGFYNLASFTLQEAE